VPVAAQSPSTDSVAVPDWVPADSVNPWIEVSAHRDTKTGFWRYIYRVHNRQPATQALTKLGLLLHAAVDSAKAPDGWWTVVYNAPSMLPGVTFAAKQAKDGSWPGAALPGGSPVVLEIVSREPPGPIRFYARGSAPPVSLERLGPTTWARMPSEQEDARRGETIGPVSRTDHAPTQ
jgi:hypothetical protein